MQKNRERWMKLAEMAANEQNPDKLVALVREINRLLEEKHQRLSTTKGAPESVELIEAREDENGEV